MRRPRTVQIDNDGTFVRVDQLVGAEVVMSPHRRRDRPRYSVHVALMNGEVAQGHYMNSPFDADGLLLAVRDAMEGF